MYPAQFYLYTVNILYSACAIFGGFCKSAILRGFYLVFDFNPLHHTLIKVIYSARCICLAERHDRSRRLEEYIAIRNYVIRLQYWAVNWFSTNLKNFSYIETSSLPVKGYDIRVYTEKNKRSADLIHGCNYLILLLFKGG